MNAAVLAILSFADRISPHCKTGRRHAGGGLTWTFQ
jgi:hypothetical protein